MKDIDALFDDCKFPQLESPYDDALKEAVSPWKQCGSVGEWCSLRG